MAQTLLCVHLPAEAMLTPQAMAVMYVRRDLRHLSALQHDRARRSLCERLKPYSLPAGHAACQEGDKSDTVWLLSEGKQTHHCIPLVLLHNNMIMDLGILLLSLLVRSFAVIGVAAVTVVFSINCHEFDCCHHGSS